MLDYHISLPPREYSQWAAGGEESAFPALGAGPAPVAEAPWRPGVAAVVAAVVAAAVVAAVAAAAAVVVAAAAAVVAVKTKQKGPSGNCLGNAHTNRAQEGLKEEGRSMQ